MALIPAGSLPKIERKPLTPETWKALSEAEREQRWNQMAPAERVAAVTPNLESAPLLPEMKEINVSQPGIARTLKIIGALSLIAAIFGFLAALNASASDKSSLSFVQLSIAGFSGMIGCWAWAEIIVQTHRAAFFAELHYSTLPDQLINRPS